MCGGVFEGETALLCDDVTTAIGEMRLSEVRVGVCVREGGGVSVCEREEARDGEVGVCARGGTIGGVERCVCVKEGVGK